jgi:hypothetical protein
VQVEHTAILNDLCHAVASQEDHPRSPNLLGLGDGFISPSYQASFFPIRLIATSLTNSGTRLSVQTTCALA